MVASSIRGRAFEKKVGEILKRFAQDHPHRVAFQRQPHIVLRTKEEKRPDFVLLTVLPDARRFIFIECQDRKKYDRSLFHRIKEVLGNSWISKFYVVTSSSLPAKLSKSFRKDGIHVFTLESFKVHISKMADTIRGLPDSQSSSDPADPALLVTLYDKFRWELPMPYLADLVNEETAPCQLRETGLSATQAHEVLKLDDGQEDQALTGQVNRELPAIDSKLFNNVVAQLIAQGFSVSEARALARELLRRSPM